MIIYSKSEQKSAGTFIAFTNPYKPIKNQYLKEVVNLYSVCQIGNQYLKEVVNLSQHVSINKSNKNLVRVYNNMIDINNIFPKIFVLCNLAFVSKLYPIL